MTLRISRRKALHCSGVVLAGGLTGCNALAERNEKFTFCHLELVNEDHRSHRIHLLIKADGDTIHRGSYVLSAATGDIVSDTEFDPREWFDGTARRLTLQGRVDDREPVGPVTLTAAEVGEYAVIIYHIQDDGSLDIYYLVGGADSCSRRS